MSIQIREEIASGVYRVWDLRNILCAEKTDYQTVVIGESPSQGVMLFIDGKRQSSQATEEIYHEGMIVPALLCNPHPAKCLVVGSGEGVLPKMLPRKSIVHHVDIDERLLSLCAQHLPYGYTKNDLATIASGKSNVKIFTQDIWRFVDSSDGGYDLIVVDLTEPSEEGDLYTLNFFSAMKDELAPGGVLITQAGSPNLINLDDLTYVWSMMRKVFPEDFVRPFTLQCQGWSWILYSPEPPSLDVKDLHFTPKHIDRATVSSSLTIPKTLLDAMNDESLN